MLYLENRKKDQRLHSSAVYGNVIVTLNHPKNAPKYPAINVQKAATKVALYAPTSTGGKAPVKYTASVIETPLNIGKTALPRLGFLKL